MIHVMAHSSRYHYLMKLVVISSPSFYIFRKFSIFFIVSNNIFNVSSNLDIFLPLIRYLWSWMLRLAKHQITSVRRNEENKIEVCTSKLPAQFVHITHILVDARLVLRFHGFHRRFSHESWFVSVTHAVAFKPLSVLVSS